MRRKIYRKFGIQVVIKYRLDIALVQVGHEANLNKIYHSGISILEMKYATYGEIIN